MLRFLTAGSCDNGKSTLIGRLLFDSRNYEDQLDALERDSKRMGDASDRMIPTVDGLKAERDGITIDVAYRYFLHE